MRCQCFVLDAILDTTPVIMLIVGRVCRAALEGQHPFMSRCRDYTPSGPFEH